MTEAAQAPRKYPRSTFRSSAKYGPCEVCREHVAEVFLTPTEQGTNYAFGHATCIAPLTSTRVAQVTRNDILTTPNGAIYRCDGCADVTIVESTPATLVVLVSGQLWSWRPQGLLALAAAGYRHVGDEDAEVLAERVKAAESSARLRFDKEEVAA